MKGACRKHVSPCVLSVSTARTYEKGDSYLLVIKCTQFKKYKDKKLSKIEFILSFKNIFEQFEYINLYNKYRTREKKYKYCTKSDPIFACHLGNIEKVKE